MNGRLYDPLIGRFLSPDNNVQMPDYTQNFNRYSYALNNPLKYTDPDGEWFVFDDLVSFIAGGLTNVIFNWGKIDNLWEGLSYFGTGGVGTWIAVQSFGLAAPVGASITSFGNNLLETNFLTEEKGYSLKNISQKEWIAIGEKTAIGFATGYLGDKLGGAISDKINIKSDFWSKSTDRMLKGGITDGFYGYFNSTIIEKNKWYSQEAWIDFGFGFGSGVAIGFTYTYLEQKVVYPEMQKLKELSISLKLNSEKSYKFIINNSYNPLLPSKTYIPFDNKIYLPHNK